MTFLFWKSMDLLIATEVNDWTARPRSGVREGAAEHQPSDELHFRIMAVHVYDAALGLCQGHITEVLIVCSIASPS